MPRAGVRPINPVIYCTTNLVDGKKYIGKDWFNDPKYLGSGVRFARALKKYGKENFQKEILQTGMVGKEQINEAERYWIDYFGAVKSDLFYNLADGGDGGMSEEKRQNFVPHPNSLVALQKLAEKRIGTRMSEETKRALIKSHKGKPWTEKQRISIMKSKENWDRGNKVVQLEAVVTYKVVKVWKSASAATKFFGGKENLINSLCRKRGMGIKGDGRKNSTGFEWMYLTDYEQK